LVTSPAGFAELITRAATPAHLAGPDTEVDLERFPSVSAELGDQILGPPGTRPADL
jgi:hypothetical protein